MPVTVVTYEDVLAAARRIAPYVHRTPVFTNSHIDKLVGRKVFFKCESFQKTGSFKVRGALNAVLKLKETNPNHPGVATHSSGNHAQALAHAATCAGLSSSVVVPDNCPAVKCEAIRGYGATLSFCKPNPVSRTETCDAVCQKLGQVYISSHDHLDVIAGQGTMAVEFFEDVPDLDAIFATASGGGMVSGISVATKAIRPESRVYVVEPKGKELEPRLRSGVRSWPVPLQYVDTMYSPGVRSWPIPPQYVDTIADGIRVQTIGENCFSIMKETVEKDVFTVNNHEISEAMKLIWARMKLVVETSAAAALAAVLSDKMKDLDPSITKVGVILCGGNVDLDSLPWQQGY